MKIIIRQPILRAIHIIVTLASLAFVCLKGIGFISNIYHSNLPSVAKFINIALIGIGIPLGVLFLSVVYEYILSFGGLKTKFKNPIREFGRRADKMFS